MTLLLVVLLVLLWGAVIVPTLLRARQTSESSVGSFRKHMHALGRRSTGRSFTRRTPGGRTMAINPGRWIIAPPPGPGSRPTETWEPTVAQRRLVFIVLLSAAAGSLLLGFIPGLGLLLKVHVGIDAVLAGYVVFLLRTKHVTARRQGLVSFQTQEVEERHYLRASQF